MACFVELYQILNSKLFNDFWQSEQTSKTG